MPGFLGDKPDFHRGDQVSARKLRQIVDNLMRQLRGGAGVNVGQFGDRQTLSSEQLTQLPDIGNYLCQFVVLEEHEDLLLCTPLTLPVYPFPPSAPFRWIPQRFDSYVGQDNPVKVLVAKPYDLQYTPWNLRYIQEGHYDQVPTDQMMAVISIGGGIRSVRRIPVGMTLTSALDLSGTLLPNHLYYYYVTVVTATGNEQAISNQCRAITSSGNQKVVLTWTAFPVPSGYPAIIGYNVYRSGSPSVGGGLVAELGDVLTYTDDGSITPDEFTNPNFLYKVGGIQDVITPSYQVGSQIVAAKLVTGYVDATQGDIPVVWQDLNVGGRKWSNPNFFTSARLITTGTGTQEILSAGGAPILWFNPLPAGDTFWDTGNYYQGPDPSGTDSDSRIYFPFSGYYEVTYNITFTVASPTITAGDVRAWVTTFIAGGQQGVSYVNPGRAGTYSLSGRTTLQIDLYDYMTVVVQKDSLSPDRTQDILFAELSISYLGQL